MEKICQNSTCNKPLPKKKGRGQKIKYCSAKCRQEVFLRDYLRYSEVDKKL